MLEDAGAAGSAEARLASITEEDMTNNEYILRMRLIREQYRTRNALIGGLFLGLLIGLIPSLGLI